MGDAGPPQQRRLLAELLGMGIWDFRCRSHTHPVGAEEANDEHSIVFVRRGAFGRTHHRDPHLADANHVLFFNAGQPYRISHPLPGGDECTIVSLTPRLARELVSEHDPRAAEREDRPFRSAQALSTPRAARLHWELLARLPLGHAGAAGMKSPIEPEGGLAAEDTLAELVREALAAGAGGDDQLAPSAHEKRRREAVEEVKLQLHARLDNPPGLESLARGVGLSPFHLSRSFRRVCGLSLRRYFSRLRAREAAPRLARGDRDLTALALDLGYADHSHLTNSFRAEWGMPPSTFRERSRSGT